MQKRNGKAKRGNKLQVPTCSVETFQSEAAAVPIHRDTPGKICGGLPTRRYDKAGFAPFTAARTECDALPFAAVPIHRDTLQQGKICGGLPTRRYDKARFAAVIDRPIQQNK
jgi:hypothetical protein